MGRNIEKRKVVKVVNALSQRRIESDPKRKKLSYHLLWDNNELVSPESVRSGFSAVRHEIQEKDKQKEKRTFKNDARLTASWMRRRQEEKQKADRRRQKNGEKLQSSLPWAAVSIRRTAVTPIVMETSGKTQSTSATPLLIPKSVKP